MPRLSRQVLLVSQKNWDYLSQKDSGGAVCCGLVMSHFDTHKSQENQRCECGRCKGATAWTFWNEQVTVGPWATAQAQLGEATPVSCQIGLQYFNF